MNEQQGSETRLPEAIPDCEDNTMIDNIQSTCCVGTSEIQVGTSVTSTSMPNQRMDNWVPKPAACRISIPEQSSFERTNSGCSYESDQQDHSSDKTASREVHIQPGVDTNLSTIPEHPRKDLSIFKSLNSTLGEEQSNREDMVRARKVQLCHIFLEQKANESNKPFIDTSNAIGRKPAACILSSFFTCRQP